MLGVLYNEGAVSVSMVVRAELLFKFGKHRQLSFIIYTTFLQL